MWRKIWAIVIDGILVIVLLCDGDGKFVIEVFFYNDSRGVVMMNKLKSIVFFNYLVISVIFSLVKLLWLVENIFGLN